jgi:hypothetical protein
MPQNTVCSTLAEKHAETPNPARKAAHTCKAAHARKAGWTNYDELLDVNHIVRLRQAHTYCVVRGTHHH